MRISRPQMFMEIAHVVAKRATCFRLNVGAVIVADRRIVSIGYNGAPSGAPHCSGNDCPGRFHCKETTHAEVNALSHLPASWRHAAIDLYVTDSPCPACWDVIKTNVYIERVFFATPYRITDHLTGVGPGLYRVLPAGYVMDWRTKELVDVET